MKLVNYYQPKFVTHPSIEKDQIVGLHYRHESRFSLLLNALPFARAVINDPLAFSLQVSTHAPDPAAIAVDSRLQCLNQAAIDCLTLPDLNEELRLYALGVMLSTAANLPDDADTCEHIVNLPAWLARHAASGELQRMYAQLPTIDVLKNQLIRELGVMSFDWSRLPESPRSATLPMQVSLLMLQDANSEAQLQMQLAQVWRESGRACLAERPWMLTHYLVYRLYHDYFPGAQAGRQYLNLVSDYFQLKALLSLWMIDGTPLAADDVAVFISLFEDWRLSGAQKQERDCTHELFAGDDLLAAFSLIAQ